MENYKRVLFGQGLMKEEVTAIRSYKHEVFTVKQNKVALTAYDDKRFLLESGLDSVPYGYSSVDPCSKKQPGMKHMYQKTTLAHKTVAHLADNGTLEMEAVHARNSGGVKIAEPGVLKRWWLCVIWEHHQEIFITSTIVHKVQNAFSSSMKQSSKPTM
jgi:hypothetical protein